MKMSPTLQKVLSKRRQKTVVTEAPEKKNNFIVPAYVALACVIVGFIGFQVGSMKVEAKYQSALLKQQRDVMMMLHTRTQENHVLLSRQLSKQEEQLMELKKIAWATHATGSR
ncbi:hypothetical protein [Terasakiella sp. SH-1]|uniref:hypothetical protein n=1 Tax=Terasakiella sp. SH-1 TaxID=2560057 RepID=UPI001073CAA5|nr:hypothetical protein [Terasakiella sp. SH-1]